MTREELKRSPRQYPFHGFAPGDYFAHCADCGQTFTGDKRAVRCEECAEALAEASNNMTVESELVEAVAALA